MMHVWIDGQCLQTASKDRGIGRYVFNLTKALARNPTKPKLSISLNASMPDEFIVARDQLNSIAGNVQIHAWQGVAAQGESFEGFSNQRNLSEVALSHHVACIGPDIALSASPFEGSGDRAVPLFSSFGHSYPICAIFYDAIPHRYPKQYLNNTKANAFYRRRFTNLANHASMLGISAFATTEAKTLFPQLDVFQIDAGLSDEFSPKIGMLTARSRNLRVSSSPYVLYVGGLDWRKNVTEVVVAFSMLPLRISQKLKLVVAGAYPDHSGAELKARWKSLRLDSTNLLMLGRVSDDQLMELYSQAELSIQPSLMEGFGLTALESVRCGTPVIGSNRGALPEVICDPRAMFDPTNPHEIMDRILQFIEDEHFARTVARVQHAHVSKFTWSRTSNLAMVAMKKTIEKFNLQVENAGQIRTQDIDELRKITFKALGKGLLEERNVTDIMSVAEPARNRSARLYIDVTSTSKTNYTSGIQRVVRKIAAEIVSDNGFADRIEPILCFSDKLTHFTRAVISPNGIISIDKKFQNEVLSFVRNDHILMLDLSLDHYKIHHHILNKARIIGAQVISCLYDFVPIKFSAMSYRDTSLLYTQWLESALSISNGFVCISKAVADELLELLRAIQFPRRMKVGYWSLGADFKSSATTRTLRKSFNAEQPRFLMVGTIEPRKNHLLVLQAFSELWAEGFGGTLTIIGKRGWSDGHIVLAIKTNKEFERKLRWLKNANDDKLIESYQSHDVLIAASHAEGFGLPIVEGLQHGCQVLASDIPVFREVAGNSASVRYFIPDSRQSLMDKIQSTAAVSAANEIGDAPAWVGWNESARRLAEVIIDDKWYQEYIPARPVTGFSVGIGSIHITRKLSYNETKHRLAIVGPVARLNSGITLKYTVKVTNESKELFSSRGNSDGSLGVYLGYHIIARDGGMLRFKNPRISIPFVIPPGVSVYLPVEINLWSLPSNAAFLDIEMVQEGGEWWGQPLRVAIYE